MTDDYFVSADLGRSASLFLPFSAPPQPTDAKTSVAKIRQRAEVRIMWSLRKEPIKKNKPTGKPVGLFDAHYQFTWWVGSLVGWCWLGSLGSGPCLGRRCCHRNRGRRPRRRERLRGRESSSSRNSKEIVIGRSQHPQLELCPGHPGCDLTYQTHPGRHYSQEFEIYAESEMGSTIPDEIRPFRTTGE